MQTISDHIIALFKKHNNADIVNIDKLPQAGSDRHYFRLYTPGKNFIATYVRNIKENESFIYFSEQFKKKQLTIPEIFYVSEDTCCYIQEDFGNTCLMDKLEQQGCTTDVYELYKKSCDRISGTGCY